MIIKKNKSIKIITSAIGIVILAMAVSIIIKLQKNNIDIEKIKTLPAFSFKSIDGKLISSDSIGIMHNTIIMLHSTDCMHCLTTFDQIIELVSDYPSFQIIMVSPDSLNLIENFRDRFDLDPDLPILFTQSDEQELFRIFGSFNYPTIFCYNSNNELIEKITGDVSTDRLRQLYERN